MRLYTFVLLNMRRGVRLDEGGDACRHCALTAAGRRKKEAAVTPPGGNAIESAAPFFCALQPLGHNVDRRLRIRPGGHLDAY